MAKLNQEMARRRTMNVCTAILIAAATALSRSSGAVTGDATGTAPARPDLPSSALAPDPQAAALVAQAEAALRESSAEKLADAFGGAPPSWARSWVERRG